MISDSQQQTTMAGESALDKLLLSSDDDEMSDFDLETRKRNNTLPSSDKMKRPRVLKLSSAELQHANTPEESAVRPDIILTTTNAEM